MTIEWLILALTVGLFVAALFIEGRWLILVPVVGWSVFYLGLLAGWWGFGVGDYWYLPYLVITLGGVGVVLAGRLTRRLSGRSSG